VVQYWLAKKNEIPQLFELAEIVMAVPATQVNCSCAFKVLNIYVPTMYLHIN